MLDLVLESLEAVPSRVANKGLVSLFNPNYIPHMLGFKFQYYQKPSSGPVRTHRSRHSTPSAPLRLTT